MEPPADGAALLEARAITKRFGGLVALGAVSLTVNRGEIFGLIGPNGAGKTTFFNLLTGLYRPDQGRFVFDRAELTAAKPHIVAARGIARTFQNIRLFANMTALENVMVGRHVRTRAGVAGAVLRGRATRAEEAAITQRAYALLDYVGIAARAGELARGLPYGVQRRLEIARALATEPKLLALDEPAAGDFRPPAHAGRRRAADVLRCGLVQRPWPNPDPDRLWPAGTAAGRRDCGCSAAAHRNCREESGVVEQHPRDLSIGQRRSTHGAGRAGNLHGTGANQL